MMSFTEHTSVYIPITMTTSNLAFLERYTMLDLTGLRNCSGLQYINTNIHRWDWPTLMANPGFNIDLIRNDIAYGYAALDLDPTPPGTIYGDRQNVHQSRVQASIKLNPKYPK